MSWPEEWAFQLEDRPLCSPTHPTVFSRFLLAVALFAVAGQTRAAVFTVDRTDDDAAAIGCDDAAAIAACAARFARPMPWRAPIRLRSPKVPTL